jgi:hypothetical protein
LSQFHTSTFTYNPIEHLPLCNDTTSKASIPLPPHRIPQTCPTVSTQPGLPSLPSTRSTRHKETKQPKNPPRRSKRTTMPPQQRTRQCKYPRIYLPAHKITNVRLTLPSQLQALPRRAKHLHRRRNSHARSPRYPRRASRRRSQRLHPGRLRQARRARSRADGRAW